MIGSRGTSINSAPSFGHRDLSSSPHHPPSLTRAYQAQFLAQAQAAQAAAQASAASASTSSAAGKQQQQQQQQPKTHLSESINNAHGFYYNTSLVNKVDKLGQTPLHLAVQSRDRPTIELLLRCGADVKLIAYKNRSLIHFLLDPEDEWERDEYTGKKPVRAPAIANGQNNNNINKSKEPDLTSSDEHEIAEILKLLLDKGAPIDAVDDDGKTVLHLAAENKLKECMVVLLPYCDAILAERDVWSLTALHLLLESVKNEDGEEENEYYEIVGYMLRKCPELMDFDDRCGGTLLHIAAQHKQRRIVQLLLSHSGRA